MQRNAFPYEIKKGTIETVVQLSQQIPEFYEPHGVEEYENRLENTNHLILEAYDGLLPIGFKVGYEREGYFYSWMGGVLPNYRGKGVAQQLADEQESWAKQQKYPHVTFKTRNSHSRCFGRRRVYRGVTAFLYRKIRLVLLRTLPRRLGVGTQVWGQKNLPDGPGKHPGSPPGNRARRVGRGRHPDGQTRPALSGRNPIDARGYRLAHRRLPGQRRVRDAQGRSTKRLVGRKKNRDRGADGHSARGLGFDLHLLRQGSRWLALSVMAAGGGRQRWAWGLAFPLGEGARSRRRC